MQRKKSGFFFHRANILLQPKYHKRTASSSINEKQRSYLQYFKCIDVKPYVSNCSCVLQGVFQVLRCMCSKVSFSGKKGQFA